MDPADMVELLFDASAAALAAVERLDERGPSDRPGQYRLDLAADDAAVAMLTRAGMSVLSEESGLTKRPGALLAVLDPIDGSTNADRGIPFYSTSICVFDADGPWVGAVVNHATRQRFHAIRGAGAWRDGAPIAPSRCQSLADSVIGVSGTVPVPSWQRRCLGSAALEFCLVADGSLDAYVLGEGIDLRPWDYLGGLLICVEAGAAVAELDGRDLWIRTDDARRPVAAANDQLLRTVMTRFGEE
jgi:myo-inositol-1(or 4)-monophosphatase